MNKDEQIRTLTKILCDLMPHVIKDYERGRDDIGFRRVVQAAASHLLARIPAPPEEISIRKVEPILLKVSQRPTK